MNLDLFKEKLMLLNPDDDDFTSQSEAIIEKNGRTLGESAIPIILGFFEKHALSDCGNPGVFVHFIENYYPKYKDQLIESVKSKPALSTLLMVNRILNSNLLEQDREDYMSALIHVSQNNFHEALRIEAQEYIEYQKNS